MMKLFFKSNTVFIPLIILFSCSSKQELFIDYSDPLIEYSGRIDTSRLKGADLYWSGTSVRISFEGESVSALLEDETGDNYYNVIVDEDSIFILRPDTSRKYYTLASGLAAGKHKVEIFRRTEWERGNTTFYGFQIKGNSVLGHKQDPPKRKIEFYGNSITAGYAIEDFSGKDSPDSIYTNNYLSYSAITARHFGADYRCICKSGIGIMISWFPLIMPEMYNRLVPGDSASRWDFSLYTPDVVVINLLQNDSWLVNMPEDREFKARFGDKTPDEAFIVQSYKEFVGSLRKEYPNAQIICALGSMSATREGSPWPDYIEMAVKELNDPKIFTHFFPYKETPGHPDLAGHVDMANSLIQFIEDNIEW